MRRVFPIVLVTCCLMSGPLLAQTNVAEGKDVYLRGEFFFNPSGGSVADASTIVDGIFLPPGTAWNDGTVWWVMGGCSDGGGPCFIEVDLGGDYLVDSFVFQGDSDFYFLDYWDLNANEWRSAWEVGPHPPESGFFGGVQTRPNPTDTTQRHVLPEPIVTNRLRVVPSPPMWDPPHFPGTDDLYGVSEIQAFGEPYVPPPPMNAIDIATQGYFHLRTGLVLMCGADVCAEPSGPNVASNLFSFTHPDTPRLGRVTEWKVEKVNKSVAKGSMIIEKSCANCFMGGPIDGEIFVEFTIRTEYVPPIEEGEEQHHNFHGPFHIVGGSGSYSGITGQGTMNGTVHAHIRPGFPPQVNWYLDFVMVGNAKVD